MIGFRNVAARRSVPVIAVLLAAAVGAVVARSGPRAIDQPTSATTPTIIPPDRTGVPSWAEKIGDDDGSSAVPIVRDRATGIEMVLVPAGSFFMGSLPSDADHSPNETPRHRVEIIQPFYLGRFEVRQSEFERMMGWNPSRLRGPDLPVEMVAWNDVVGPGGFLAEANRRANYYGPKTPPLRLPTEAEWEYACRSGSVGPYAFDEPITINLANYDDSESVVADSVRPRSPRPVATYRPNRWGLHNMHGNVHELCADSFHAEFYADPRASLPDPLCREPGGFTPSQVIRGGSWIDGPAALRSASRGRISPDGRYSTVGFRVCRTANP